MSSENLERKADRLLTSGCVNILRVRPKTGLVLAEVKGDHDVYALGYDPDEQEWRCTCPGSASFHRRCSHLIAVQRVVSRHRLEASPRPDPEDDARLIRVALEQLRRASHSDVDEHVLEALDRLAARR